MSSSTCSSFTLQIIILKTCICDFCWEEIILNPRVNNQFSLVVVNSSSLRDHKIEIFLFFFKFFLGGGRDLATAMTMVKTPTTSSISKPQTQTSLLTNSVKNIGKLPGGLINKTHNTQGGYEVIKPNSLQSVGGVGGGIGAGGGLYGMSSGMMGTHNMGYGYQGNNITNSLLAQSKLKNNTKSEFFLFPFLMIFFLVPFFM